jgi:nucleotide-binding universal stress UspA family protein
MDLPGPGGGPPPFESITVPVDLEVMGDRALSVAGALAVLGDCPIELVCVSSAADAVADAAELQQRVERLAPARVEWTVLHHDDPVEALAAHIAENPATLLVMATHARPRFLARVLGSVSDSLVGWFRRPILVVGPEVLVEHQPWNPALVVALDRATTAAAVAPIVAKWRTTFGGADPTMAPVDRDSRGFETLTQAAESVERSAADPILVLASEHWTDTAPHLGSLARRVAHDSPYPVLVVPA